MKPSKRLIPILLVSVVAVLAACGGDSKPTGSSTTPPASGTTPPVTGNIPNFSTAECQSAALAMAAAASGGFGTGQGSPDDAVATLQRLASAAPSEVKSDLELIGREIQKFYEALKSAGADFNNPSTLSNPQIAAAAGQAAAAFQTSGAPQAQQRIQSFFAQVCPGAG